MWKESEITQKILQGYLQSRRLHPAGLVNSLGFRFRIMRDKWIWSSAWLKLLRERAGTPTHCCWFRKPFSQRQSRRAHLPQQPGGMATHTYAHCTPVPGREPQCEPQLLWVWEGGESWLVQDRSTQGRLVGWLVVFYFLVTQSAQTCACSCYSYWASYSWQCRSFGHAVFSHSKFSEDCCCFSASPFWSKA